MRDRFVLMLVLVPVAAGCAGPSALQTRHVGDRATPLATFAPPSPADTRKLLQSSGDASAGFSMEMFGCSDNYRRETTYQRVVAQGVSNWVLVKDHLDRIEGADINRCPEQWPVESTVSSSPDSLRKQRLPATPAAAAPATTGRAAAPAAGG